MRDFDQMGLLFGAALALLLAALVLHSAHPRRALAIAGIGMAGIIAAGVAYLMDREPRSPAEISAADLALSDVEIESDRYGRQLSGRIRNNSGKRLATLTLLVTYKHCSAVGACRTLGQESPRLFIALPPGQTGGFSVLLTQASLLERAGVSWDCVVASAQSDF